MKLSYKKFSKANPKNFDYENILRILKSACLLLKLNHSSYEVLCIDEFSFDTRKTNYYGWGPKNSKLYISKIPEWFTISFVVGFSIQRYYGVIGKVDSINSNVIIKYIKSWINQFQVDCKSKTSNVIIVSDNATIHKSNLVKNAIAKWKISLITIVPYWPFLNPIESYIGIVKSKIKLNRRCCQTKAFKPMTLKLIQKAFDEWAAIDSIKFIENSRKETLSAVSALARS